MSSKKHDNGALTLNKPHEENDIQLKGIIYFAIGLVALIVVTFFLMYALLNVLKDYSVENQGPANPMQMSEREKLPPEPRLQLAPGFGVETPGGRVNMELGEPQAEYRELHKMWVDMWEHGQKDPATGVARMLPLEEAKEKIVAQNPKSKTGPDAEANFANSRNYVTDQSAGRMASEKRR
jgi:hypothetical protein